MLLEKIHISNFRKFTQPVTITGLKPGFNIIAGDNEDGKSTILHAIKSAFFMKYNTSATAVIQPYNSAAMPEVHLQFQRDGQPYFLRKIFGRKGMAELRSPNGVFSGPDAEAKLQELCQTGGSKESSTMWGVLWVEQGTAFDTPQVGDLARRTLSNALEAELGNVLGGNEGHALLARTKELYLQWFTPTGKDAKKSEFSEAQEHHDSVEAQLLECSKVHQEYEATLKRLQTVRETLKKHEVERTLETAKEQLEAAFSREKQIGERKHEQEKLLASEKALQIEYSSISTEFKQRRALIVEFEAAEKAFLQTTEQIAVLQAQHMEASKQLFEAQKAYQAAEADYELRFKRAAEAERLEQHTALKTELTKLQEALAAAKAAHAEGQGIYRQAIAIKVDEAALNKLKLLERDLLQAETRLESVATRLEFAPLNERTVIQDDHQIDSSQPLLVTQTTTFELEGWGKIVVRPGGNDLDKMRDMALQLRTDFQAALQALNVSSLEEASAVERKKSDLTNEYRSLAKDVKKHAPDGIAALEAQIAALQETIGSATPDAQSLEPISLEQAKALVADTRKSRDESRVFCQQAKLSNEKCEAEFRRIDGLVGKLTVEREQLSQQRTQLATKLEQARALQQDDSIEQRMTEAKIRSEMVSQQCKEVETQLKALNSDAIEIEITTAKQRIESIEREITQLTGDQRELLGALQTFGNTGVSEDLERWQGKYEQAKAQLERSRKKARAIKLLWQTISEAERAAKDELAAPLIKHLEPFVKQVFDNGRLAFNNQDFSITHLNRNGVPEEYTKLSLGTREQLSVLTRLAFAQLLTESGSPALVILDDALVYSDQARLERMQEVLLKASVDFQILILTCRERDYSHMPGTLIRLEDCYTQADNVENLIAPASMLATVRTS